MPSSVILMAEVKATSGVDVIQAATKESLYLTETPSLKLLATDTVTFTFTDSGNFGYAVHHNLGYIPVYRVFWQTIPSVPNKWFMDSNLTDNIDIATDVNTATGCISQISSTDLELYMTGTAGNTYNARYYIFADEATP